MVEELRSILGTFFLLTILILPHQSYAVRCGNFEAVISGGIDLPQDPFSRSLTDDTLNLCNISGIMGKFKGINLYNNEITIELQAFIDSDENCYFNVTREDVYGVQVSNLFALGATYDYASGKGFLRIMTRVGWGDDILGLQEIFSSTGKLVGTANFAIFKNRSVSGVLRVTSGDPTDSVVCDDARDFDEL